MSSRRDFGSARKLPSGRYQASYWHEGRRHTADRTFPTKGDATKWLSTVRADIIKGQWIDPTLGAETVGKYAARWLAERSDLRPTTRSKYASLLRLHVLPRLGDIELAKLQPSKVRYWYHELATRYPVVADDAYRFLRAVLNTATADSMIPANPCKVRGAGQVRSAERPTATATEVAAAVEALPDRYRMGALLAALCQLRRSEVLALQRRHVDPLHKKIRIEQAWQVPLTGPATIGPPKTEAGRRTLSVPLNIWPALEDHLARYVGPQPDAWLFPTSTGTAISPRNFTRAWIAARAKIGRPDLHLHDLRHSGLTWAAASGASIAELMRRGGHANPRAALRYQHATDERDEVLAESLPPIPFAHASRTPAKGKKKAPTAVGA